MCAVIDDTGYLEHGIDATATEGEKPLCLQVGQRAQAQPGSNPALEAGLPLGRVAAHEHPHALRRLSLPVPTHLSRQCPAQNPARVGLEFGAVLLQGTARLGAEVGPVQIISCTSDSMPGSGIQARHACQGRQSSFARVVHPFSSCGEAMGRAHQGACRQQVLQ